MFDADSLNMGQEAFDSGNYDLAVVYYRKAIEANPGDYDAVKRLGHIFYLTSDFQSAANIYSRAIKRLENQVEDQRGSNRLLESFHLCLCETYLRLGCLVEAEEQVVKAAQFDINQASLRTSQANISLASGHYDEALSKFEEIINLNPDDANGYVGKAKVYQEQGQFDLAAKTLVGAQIADPESFGAELTLGNLSISMHKFEDALRHYQRANDLDPHEMAASYGIGVAYLKLGDYRKAEHAFESVLEASPQDTDAMYSLALTEMELENETRAIALLNSAISINPDNVSYYALLTKAYFTLCKFSKGLRAALMARKLYAKQKT